MEALTWLWVLGACYLLGSFPSAYLAGRVFRGVDIRDLGDGNPGAANAWAVLGAPIGAGVALLDIGKGIGAVLVARTLVEAEVGVLLGGVASVMGHNWPLFLGFRGGRGAATALGVLLALVPRAAFPLSIGALVPIILTRSTTVGFAFIFAPLSLVVWWMGYPSSLVGYSVALPVLVGVSHHLSVRRMERVAYPK